MINCRFMLTFISVIVLSEVFCIDQTTVLKFQLNVDHTSLAVTYDIVSLMVFQLVRTILQITFLFNVLAFLGLYSHKNAFWRFYSSDQRSAHLWCLLRCFRK